MESKTLAKLTGELIDVVEGLLIELEKHEVFSRDEEGIIYNRRMVREGALSQIRAEAGRLGGRPRKQNESKTKAKVKQHVKAPSASASASASASSSLNEINNKKESKGVVKEVSEIDTKLVQLLISLMEKNNPNSSILKRLTPKRQEEWINQCRLLREADGKTQEEIETIIRFSQRDIFWKSNILSMPKLREKWDQLYMKAKRESGADRYDGIKAWLDEELVKKEAR